MVTEWPTQCHEKIHKHEMVYKYAWYLAGTPHYAGGENERGGVHKLCSTQRSLKGYRVDVLRPLRVMSSTVSV